MAINKAKEGKAPGDENIPNAPSMWLKSIMHPIPKSQIEDSRVPLNIRRISLMSTV